MQFARVQIAEEVCLWEVEDSEGLSNIGCKYGFHQLPVFTWPSDLVVADERVDDPVLDVILINSLGQPALMTSFGFQAVKSWSRFKGLPFSGKLKVVDSYTLEVKEFTPGRDCMLRLPDPVYLDLNGPYRFRMRLSGYRAAARGNESIIQLVVEANEERFLSAGIYLGMF